MHITTLPSDAIRDPWAMGNTVFSSLGNHVILIQSNTENVLFHVLEIDMDGGGNVACLVLRNLYMRDKKEQVLVYIHLCDFSLFSFVNPF